MRKRGKFAAIILPEFPATRLTQICFFFCIHARTSGAIVSTTDKTRGGTERKRAFNVYFESHLCRAAHRPKWAFERWFIIRVDAKSPARFHCSGIFFFKPRRTNPAVIRLRFNSEMGGWRATFGCFVVHLYALNRRGSCGKNSIAFFFIQSKYNNGTIALYRQRRKGRFKAFVKITFQGYILFS